MNVPLKIIFSSLCVSTLCVSCLWDRNPLNQDDNGNDNPFSHGDSLRYLDFSIDRNHLSYLKTYDLQNAAALAEEYRESGMKFFGMSSPYQTRDEKDVPIVHYWFGEYRNPVTTCHTAFGYYRYYMESHNGAEKQSFLNNIEWLCTTCDKDHYLRYTFDWEHVQGVNLSAGWISAMAQGEALSAMCMAYNLTGDNKYLTTAKGLFGTLYSNTNTTWCFVVDKDGYYWLEEYPNNDFCHVLNGFLFGLWGLWDYYVITGDEFALTLFEAGVRTILDHLSFWNVENENMSWYCRHKLAGSYHQVHLTQFRAYADILGISEFDEAAELFMSTGNK